MVADQEGRESRYTVSGESGVAYRFCIRCTETTVDGYDANVPVNAETPIDWASAVDEGEAAVVREFLDIRRNSVVFYIGRRGTGDQSMRCQLSRHQAGVVAAA